VERVLLARRRPARYGERGLGVRPLRDGERGGDDGDDPRSVTPGETIARCSPSWLVRGDPTGDGDLPERVPR